MDQQSAAVLGKLLGVFLALIPSPLAAAILARRFDDWRQGVFFGVLGGVATSAALYVFPLVIM